jgi:DNA-binding winged helix-turn-helix (wHTH) protein/tetratricopeptide (TPR) repeat protein
LIYRFGHFELDASARELRADGVVVETEPKAFDVLAYLAEHRERAVTKDELLEAVWPRQIVTETALTRAVMKARRAVGDDSGSQAIIRTVHGHGYRFVADLAPESPPEAPALVDASAAPRTEAGLTWRRFAMIAIFALSILVAAGLVLLREDAPDSDDGSLAVLPVVNRVGDTQLDWVRLGLMSLLQRMLEEGGVDVVEDRRVLGAVDDAPLDVLPDAELFEQIRQRSGAGSLFYTSLDRQGGLLRLSAVLMHADGRKSRRVIVGDSPAGLAADMAAVISRLLTGADLREGGRFSKISFDPFVNELYARGLDLELQGQLDSARQLFRVAAEQEPELFWLRFEIALCTRDLREWEEADAMFRTLQEEAAAGTDPRAQIVAANSHGVMFFNQNRYDDAEPLFRQALDAAGDSEFAAERATVLVNLGLIAVRRGKIDAAAGFYAGALEAFDEAGRDASPAFLNNYAGLLARLGNLDEAREYAERAVEGFRVLGHRRYEAPSLNRLARILRRQGDLDGAVQRHEQAIAIYRELGNAVGELSALSALTSVYLERGDFSRASLNAADVLDRAAGTGDEILVADAMVQMAQVDKALSRHEQALGNYEAAREIFAELGDEPGLRAADTGIAGEALALGQVERAREIALELLSTAEASGHAGTVARSRHLLGKIAEADGDAGRARELYSAALEYARAGHDKSLLPQAAASLASLELDRGNPAAASNLLNEVRPQAGNDRAFLRLDARLAMAMGEPERAEQVLLQLRQLAGESWSADDEALLEESRQ